MRATITRLCLALALCTLAHPTHAAKLGIIVEDVDEVGTQCGVSDDGIQGRTKATLRSAGISVEPLKDVKWSAYVTHTIIKTRPDTCAASLLVQIFTPTTIPATFE